MKIKNSAIIYSGYDYQTLQGIKLLIEWLNNPTKYHRMAFEADKDSNNTPTGIDDIVCEQPNGIKDFWQVKFTPSPEKDDNRLSWSWLLNISGKTEKSRSILKKIYDAIVSVPHETLGNVILLTNKLPDRDMEFCISGSKIEFDKIDKANKDNIINQLGSDDAARFLLSKLTIQHSDDNYDAINRKIRSELLKFSNDAGAERLITRAREWAIYQDNPPSNGWIYLNHIREILSFRRPEPIPENFFVPEDYCLPNLDFHNNILEKITHSAGEVITLTGKPGGGKSTYLSFLCQELEIRKIPLIRHHYFLSTVDSTIDRLSSRVVAESLLHQVNTYHENAKADTNQPENLCKALKACAHYYSTQGKPFVVLIDGLDHVWRDNTQDKRPLDEIFKQILPVMDNLVVLIGTQLVDDNLLPHTLLTYSQKKDWLSLPGMSGDSIYEYLQYQVESKRLHLNFDENHINSEIQNSARALLKITNGYPLHVIYSCEYLSNQGLPLSDWQIKQLPPCTSGNIVNYYNELWRTLNYRQKDVLHLSCGFQFAWPRQAIGKIIKDEHETAPSVNSVAHLLSENISGVSPFHESLIVFIKSLNDHQSRINSLLPAVCEWLQLEAPSHLKDSWLWSCQALMGNSTSLRQGVKRDWILDQLVSGMPVKNYIRLLSEAETYAFNECNYAETYRHRALKNRLINGPGSQVWDGDLTKLEILSTINADIHGLNEILSRENEYSSIKLSILSIVLYFRGETERAKRLSKKAIDHYRTKIKLILSEFSQNQEIESVTLIKASTLTDTLNYDEVFNENNFADWPDNYITSFRLACLIKKELNLLMRAHQNLPSGSHHANDIEFDAIRLSILEDADIEYWPEYKNFLYQSLSKLSKAHSKKVLSDIRSEFCCPTIHRVYNVGSSQNYHFWFFSALQTRITAEGNFTWIPIKAEYNKVDISDHYDLLNELADAIGGGVAVGYQFTFDQVCSMFPVDLMIDGMEWDRDKATTTLKKEWIKIAADCHLLTTKKKISSSELKNVLEDGIFHSSWLRSWYLDLGLELLSEDAVLLLIDSEVLHQEKEIEETIYKSTTYLELAEIALRHSQIVQSKQCLTKAWDFVLGYGHRRDTTIFDILDAIDAISKIDSDSALQLLERISPIVFNICDFTDGKETRHSKQLIHSLIAKLNLQTAVSIYNQQVSDGEWYYADETINSLIRQCCLSSPIIKLLYLTGLPSSCYKYLNEQLELRNEDATEIAFNIKALLDLDIRDYSIEISESNNVGEEIILNPADYPPNSFEQLIIYLTGKSHRKKLYKIWYIYWCKQGKELELL